MTETVLSPSFIEADEAIEFLFVAIRDPYNRYSVKESMDRVTTVFNSASEVVRYKIVTDLTEMKSAIPVQFLIDVMRNDESAMIRHEAAFGVGTLGRESDSAYLIDLLKQDPNDIVRHEAAIGLAEIGGLDAIPTLEEASKDKDPNVALSAKFAIQSILLYFRQKGRVARA